MTLLPSSRDINTQAESSGNSKKLIYMFLKSLNHRAILNRSGRVRPSIHGLHQTPLCSFHVNILRCNKEPLLTEQPEGDRFLEMMDDRTFSLLRSLRVNVDQIKEDVKTRAAQGKPLTRPIPFVEAVEVPSGGETAKGEMKNYFDTQEVYSELRFAGLTAKQANIIMRIMHDLINSLVASCTERAVPASAGANEAYLFDAASSEVRNEISNSRQTHATSYRSGLARLQRDVEILEHEANEMTNLLKADLDIEVHERKNSARAEENVIQLKIQDLHNKISTRLNSELKSEIENLRWQITRRSLAAIAIIAGSLIWLTQTNSNKKTQITTQERDRKSSSSLVQVPVLAPSVSPADKSLDHTAMHVEDISSFGGIPTAPASQQHEDGSENDNGVNS